jgi:hypothetical protein
MRDGEAQLEDTLSISKIISAPRSKLQTEEETKALADLLANE